MSWEREKDYKPLKTIEEVDIMIEEWGPLMAIIDPAKTRTGSVQDQRDALNHNNYVFPLLIEKAKNGLVDLEAEYNDEFLKEFEALTPALCDQKNMTVGQKERYVKRKLENKPDSIGSRIKKYKNKLVKLEGVEKAQMNLLWTYNK